MKSFSLWHVKELWNRAWMGEERDRNLDHFLGPAGGGGVIACQNFLAALTLRRAHVKMPIAEGAHSRNPGNFEDLQAKSSPISP